ncbi:MAG: tetratricopeptide repeat protein [Actinomadura sp.]
MITHSPYVGARPFDTADAAIFHGRAEEAAALSELWRDHRLTILHGPAGVGKTSLLQAGVLPELCTGPAAQVLPVGRLAFRADFPLAALPGLNPFTFALMTSWYPDRSPARISGSAIRSLVRRNSHTDRHGARLPIFAAVDQTDLLFPGVRRRDGHRRRFVDELADAATTRDDPHLTLHLLITIRTENLEELLGLLIQAGVPAESIAEYPLQGFDPATARQTVSGPLGDLDHPLATRAEQLIAVLGAGGADLDPALLQIMCSHLWEELSPGGNIRPDLPMLVDRVLRDHCLQALATVATEHGQYPSSLAGRFRQAFGRRQRSSGVAETRDVPDAIMLALTDARLLRVDQRAGGRRYHLRQPRLRSIVRRLDPEAATSAQAEQPRLDAAEAAFTAGELDTAWRHAKAVAGATATDGRLRAAAECLLGTIAYDQDRMQPAIEHYEAATSAFGALGDTAHVGTLLAAVGQLKIDGSTAEAVNRLRAALTRLPGDLFVKTALAHALWYAGRTHAAIAVLDDALSQEGGTPEALRLRGELLADLNKAEPALRDLDRINYGDHPSSRAAWALAKRTCEGVGPAAIEEMALVDDADDSGPVLLRLARLLRLEGDADTAAGLAERAVRAQRPPLPQHMHKVAERLMLRQAF